MFLGRRSEERVYSPHTVIHRIQEKITLCAEHLTVESYTIIISLQSYLLSYLLLLVFQHPLTLSL